MSRDKDFYEVEAIVVICFAISIILVAITRFVPCILFTLVACPISLKIKTNKKGEKHYGKFSKRAEG